MQSSKEHFVEGTVSCAGLIIGTTSDDFSYSLPGRAKGGSVRSSMERASLTASGGFWAVEVARKSSMAASTSGLPVGLTGFGTRVGEDGGGVAEVLVVAVGEVETGKRWAWRA